jgi:hypothetical protein
MLLPAHRNAVHPGSQRRPLYPVKRLHIRYASTCHVAQGLTVDRAFVLADDR